MQPSLPPLRLGGKLFSPELLEQLNRHCADQPAITKTELARLVCELLPWVSPNGNPAISSALVAIAKLQRRGVLAGPRPAAARPKPPRQLRRSAAPLPPVHQLPARAESVQGLLLHLLTDSSDPLHPVWNDLIIDQHPNAATPLAGPQMRYLIGSEHGWLGALAFSSAAYGLGARDTWIGWSTAARITHLPQVVCLSRFLIRSDIRCANLASMVLGKVVRRMPAEWEQRYGTAPLLLETFVDRDRFTGRCFAAANWRRIGASTGRGRLGELDQPKSIKDIWVYPLDEQARARLQEMPPEPILATPLDECLGREDWGRHELATLELGDRRLNRRAEAILAARWRQPQSSFYGSFEGWSPAKGAYGLIEHPRAPIHFESLLQPHQQATRARMAAEPVVLLPQDTTALNFSGLKQTAGLGPLGDAGRGLWLHSMLACRPDGIPLGVLHAQCWARTEARLREDPRGRNAKSIDEKASGRWLDALHQAADDARALPATQLVNITDREGDLYELHDAIGQGPDNLHNLIRAQHDRNLEDHRKLWDFMAGQPLGQTRPVEVPRRRGQKARRAVVEIRWSAITIAAPKVGAKKNWPPLSLWAVWVCEPHPPEGVEPLEWMLLSDLSVSTAAQAWEKVQWYRCRWGIEEWHRVIKSGCCAEQREFKRAETLKRVLAFDLIVAWRILACVKLGRALPQCPASVIYTEAELAVLWAASKKKAPRPAA